MINTVALSLLLASGINVTVNYTTDSVCTDEILTFEEITVNETESLKVSLKDDVLGYVIYDDPKTDYIDGIKYNDTWLASDYIIPDYKNVPNLTLTVKVVYADNGYGTLMKILDGNFDWSSLLSNPVVLIQGIYYIISIISVVTSGILFGRYKKMKVTTTDELSNTYMDLTKSTQEMLNNKVTNIIENIVSPVFQKINDQNSKIITALVLMNSKAKDAPLALLDLLKNVDTSIDEIIEKVKKSVIESQELLESQKQEITTALQKIASQEETTNEKENTSGENETPIF